MARKSRKETVVLPAPEIDPSCRAGVYVRLSVEDKHTHTVSIETQQLIIARYRHRSGSVSIAIFALNPYLLPHFNIRLCVKHLILTINPFGKCSLLSCRRCA